MKKLQKSSELCWLLGVLFVALGVSLCSKADLGVSMIAAPAFIIADALTPVAPFFSVGVVEYVFQGVLLIIMCLLVKRWNWNYLLAFLVAVIYGYVLDLMLWLTSFIVVDGPVARWALLLVGDVITATGVACFFRTYLPLQVYELFVAETASTFHKEITKVKRVFDMALLGVSVVLVLVLFTDLTTFDWGNILVGSYHSIGLGTIVTTLINSFLIKGAGRVLDSAFGGKELWPGLKNALGRR